MHICTNSHSLKQRNGRIFLAILSYHKFDNGECIVPKKKLISWTSFFKALNVALFLPANHLLKHFISAKLSLMLVKAFRLLRKLCLLNISQIINYFILNIGFFFKSKSLLNLICYIKRKQVSKLEQ